MIESDKPRLPDIDTLLAASKEVEDKLEHAGVQDAHEWMFAIREMLYDMRRVSLELEEFFTTQKVDKQNGEELRKIVNTVLYEVLPHIKSHMEDLELSLPDSPPEARIVNGQGESTGG